MAVDLTVMPLTQNAPDYVTNVSHAVTISEIRRRCTIQAVARGQRDVNQFAAELKASGDHGKMETPAHFFGPSRQVEQLQSIQLSRRKTSHRRTAVVESCQCQNYNQCLGTSD